MKPCVIYHANCQDGAAAAVAAYLRFGEEADYIPASYGDPPPADETLQGRPVYVLDFCFERPDVERMLEICDLLVLDHHRTHADAFEGFEGPLHFDLQKSGATLSFRHFFPEREVPEFFRYVEDRDLWRFALPESREITAALRAEGGHLGFRRFLPVLESWDDGGKARLVQDGRALLKLQAQLIETMVARAERVELDGVPALAANSTVLFSEVAEACWMKLPPMGIAYFWDGPRNLYHVSLRSKPGFLVSEIALRHGGGGHDHAAAFQAAELPWR